MTNENLGTMFSMLGMLITVVSFQAGTKKHLLLLQTVGTAFYLISYIFSGGDIGVVLNAIYLIRNVWFLRLEKAPAARRYMACGVLCAAYVLAFILYNAWSSTGSVWWDVLPILGALFGTIAVVNVDINKIRMWKYGDSLSWLVYNCHIGLGALGGIVGEIFNLVSLTIGIYKNKKTGDRFEAQS